MDLLTFISKLIDSIAWPVAAVILAATFRRQISELLPMVRKFKAGPLEAEFEREILELRSTASTTPPIQDSSRPAWQDAAERVVEINTKAGIMEAWRETEAALIRALKTQNPATTDESVRSTRDVLRLIGERGLATSEEVAMLNQLRFLRNQATHVEEFQPSKDAALNFVSLAAEMVSRLKNVQKNAP